MMDEALPIAEQPAAAPPPRVPVSIERVAAALAMGCICLITFANVVVRYFTNYSFAFTEEFSIALMVVMTLFGSAVAVVSDRHIRITVAVERLPDRWRRPAEVAALLATAAMFALLVWYGTRLAWDDYRFEVTSPGLGEPQWLYTVWLPVLSLLVLARTLGRLVRTLKP